MRATKHLAGIAAAVLGFLAQRGDCASFALADFTAAGGLLAGGIRFDQLDETEPVRVFVNLYNLVKPPNSWYITAFPVMDGDCTTESVGNPFNPTKSEAEFNCPNKKTNADCRVGDMAGKFGRLEAEKASMVFMDDTLQLRGAFSIVNRAVVLVDADGFPYACATINDATPSRLLEAKFGPPQPLVGSIWMSQTSDDPMADTTVLINLTFADGRALKGAMYHVHEGSMLEPGANCSTLKAHFNPTMAAPCKNDPATWSTCELGDISGRHGPLMLPATRDARLFFTDTFLPLSGPYGMEDRSIVVHDKAGKRLSCAALVASQVRFTSAVLVENGQKDGQPAVKYPKPEEPKEEEAPKDAIAPKDGPAGGPAPAPAAPADANAQPDAAAHHHAAPAAAPADPPAAAPVAAASAPKASPQPLEKPAAPAAPKTLLRA